MVARGRRHWVGALAGAGLVLALGPLAGCGGNAENNADNASLRLLNASVGYASLDLALGTTPANSAIAPGAVGAYASAGTTGVSTVISMNGLALSSISRSLGAGKHYTLVAYGPAGALKTVLVGEDVAAASSGQASLQVLNLATDAGSVDVYLTGSSDALEDATPTAASVAGGGSAPYATVTAGTYRLRVTGAGDKTDLRLDVQGLVLGSTQVATLALSEGVGGVLVNSLLLQQQGTASALNNPQARVRVVAAVDGAASLAVQAGGTAVVAGITPPNIGSYVLVTGGKAVPVNISVDGGTVSSLQDLSAGGDYTLLVWGDKAAPQLTRVVDDNRYPTVAGYAKIRMVNGITGTAPAMTLKADFSAVGGAINPGQVSAYVNVAANSAMRLDVGSGTNAAVYTLTGAGVVAKGLYTMYLLGPMAELVADFRRER